MKANRVYDVIRGAKISEKSSILGEKYNQYVFLVAPDATKLEVAEAIQSLFSVKVESVRVANIKGKRKFFGRRQGVRNAVRKAYVSLAQGDQINLEVEA